MACRLTRHPQRASQVPDRSFRARRLLPPRRVPPVLPTIPSRRVLASTSWRGWPLPLSVTRLNRVRFRCGSRVRLPRLRRRDYSHSPLGRLHVQWSIHTADSFHSARTFRLILAHPSRKEDIRRARGCSPPNTPRPRSALQNRPSAGGTGGRADSTTMHATDRISREVSCAAGRCPALNPAASGRRRVRGSG
jgi:hypothetical protein